MPSVYIAAFLASLLLSFILTRSVRNLAIARGWIAAPAFVHHIHQKPVPRLGGVAIFLSVAAVLGVITLGSHLFGFSLGFSRWVIVYILISGAAVFLLGLYDDLRSASPYVKLSVQSLAAAWLYFEGFGVFQVPLLFGERNFGWLGLPLTIFWMLLITNAFNLIDGLDGLASGSALFSTLTVFAIALINNVPLVALLTVILAGAIVGFLRFNFNPATIFLGDCGSLFIGFILGALALVGSYKTPTVVAVAIPVVSFGLPILETGLSVLRRFLSGQPLFSGDREHIHHKLIERGLSQRQAVMVLYAVSAVLGLLSMLLLTPGSAPIGVVLFVLGVGIWLAVQHLGYHEFIEIRRMGRRTMEQKRVIANNLAVRRAAARLKNAETFDEMCHALRSGFEGNDFDGFDLHLTPQVGGGDCNKELDCRWRKRLDLTEEAAAWRIRLDIVAPDRGSLGYFNLFRSYSDKPLMADVNLLISDFNAALSEAALRVIDAAGRPPDPARADRLVAGAAPKGFMADLGAKAVE